MQDKDGKTAQGGSMTRQQAEQEMEQLRKVFPSVRMLTAEQVQAGEAVGDAARQALEEKTTHSRMEYRGQELYEVTALFAQVEGTPCVLELERRLDRIMLLDPEESEQLFNNLAEYRGKLYRDAVTGAYNERYYQEKYRSRILTAGVAVLRVDDFKAANDVYGRYAGNSVLETVAGVLRRNLGEKDRLIRRGERTNIRKRLHPPLVIAAHGLDARLLEHDLAHPDAVGRRLAPPRQVSVSLVVPLEQRLDDRLRHAAQCFISSSV